MAKRKPEKLMSPPAGAGGDQETVPTACQYCVVGCGYEAHIWATEAGVSAPPQLEQAHWVSPAMTGPVRRDGVEKVAAVTPDPKCSMNRGNHSPRGGTQGRELVFSSDEKGRETDATGERITTPYIRTREGYRAITMDDALDIVAELVKTAAGWRRVGDRVRFKNPGGLGVKVFEYQYLENTFAATRLFYQLIGTPNVAYHDRPSVASNTQGFNDSGIHPHGYAYDDIWDSDVLFLVGNNPYECHSVFFMQYMAGKKIIVLDPRRTITADYAVKTGGLHLQPSVLGADTFVLNALARAIRDRQWEKKSGRWQLRAKGWPSRAPLDLIRSAEQLARDREEAAKSPRAMGPDRRRKALNRLSLSDYFDFLDDADGPNYSLERAEEISGIPRARLEQAIHILAGPATDVAADLPEPAERKVSLIFEKGLIWGYSYQNTAAMANLGLLLGSVLRPGEARSTHGVTGRAGGHQKGWAEVRYEVERLAKDHEGARGRSWVAGYPFYNASDTYDSGGEFGAIRTHHYLDAHLLGAAVAPRHPKASGPSAPDIQLLWIIGSNAGGQIGNAQAKVAAIQERRGAARPESAEKAEVLRALRSRMKAGGLVVIQQDIYPNPTTELADLILPASGWGEQDFTRYTGERRLRLYGRFQDPPGHRDPQSGALELDGCGRPVSRCLADWEIFKGVGRRLLPDRSRGHGLPESYKGPELTAAEHFSWAGSAAVFQDMAQNSNRKSWLGALESRGGSPRGHSLLRERGTEGYILPLRARGDCGGFIEHKRVPVPGPEDPPYAFVRADWKAIAEDFEKNAARADRGEFFICNGRVNELWNSMFSHIRNETVRQRWPDDMPGTVLELDPSHAEELTRTSGIAVTNGSVVEVECRDVHLGAKRAAFLAVVSLQKIFSEDSARKPRTAFAIFSYPSMKKGGLPRFPYREFTTRGYVNNLTTGYVDPINPIAAVKYARGTIRPTGERYRSGESRLGLSHAPRSLAFESQRVPLRATRQQRLDWQMRELIVQRGLMRSKLRGHYNLIDRKGGRSPDARDFSASLLRDPDAMLRELKTNPNRFSGRLASMRWRGRGQGRDDLDFWEDPYLSFAKRWAESQSGPGAGDPREAMLQLLKSKKAAAQGTHDFVSTGPGESLKDLFSGERFDDILAFLQTATWNRQRLIVPKKPEKSEFFKLITDGVMSRFFNSREVEVVERWIMSLQAEGGAGDDAMLALLERKRDNAQLTHAFVRVAEGLNLQKLFQDRRYTRILEYLKEGSYRGKKLIVSREPRRSHFFALITEGAMSGVFAAAEVEVVRAWILGLPKEDTAQDPRGAMIELLRAKRSIGSTVHDAIRIDGVTLGELFEAEDYEAILAFLEKGQSQRRPFAGMPLVSPRRLDQSALYLQLTDPRGRMVGRLREAELDIVRAWIMSLHEPAIEGGAEASPSLRLSATRVADGLTRPVFAASPPGDENRLFLVEQTGAIRILDLQTRQLRADPFLVVEDLSSGGERGLLGLAFHPEYEINRRFFINCTDANGATTVREYRTLETDENRADPQSLKLLLRIAQPFENHNGGWIGFGPRDGYLYIGTGDGGYINDPHDHAQNLGSLLGKLLRIDINTADQGPAYRVPDDNPFVSRTGARPEIWAYGLRNPWRCSFDRDSAELYIGDVGQDEREEINVQPADSVGGQNFGWRIKEGSRPTGLSPLAPSLTDPVHEYDRGSSGGAVIGGYVYRGSVAAAMSGRYFFADMIGKVWSLRCRDGKAQDLREHTEELGSGAQRIRRISSFAEDANGELYLLSLSGEVFQLSVSDPEAEMLELLSAKSGAATSFHFGIEVGGETLNDLFAEERFADILEYLKTGTGADGSRLVVPRNPNASRLYQQITTGVMSFAFNEQERTIVRRWIESLAPVSFVAAMLDLLSAKSSAATSFHFGIEVGGETLNDLFAEERFADILEYLKTGTGADGSRLVVPRNPNASRLYQQITTGVMSFAFNQQERAIVRQWIEGLGG